jgi:hypothetical protein
MRDIELSPADQNMRSFVLLFGIACLGATGLTVFNQWPNLSLYAVLLAVVGGVLLAVYMWAPITVSRTICKVISLGIWR